MRVMKTLNGRIAHWFVGGIFLHLHPLPTPLLTLFISLSLFFFRVVLSRGPWRKPEIIYEIYWGRRNEEETLYHVIIFFWFHFVSLYALIHGVVLLYLLFLSCV
jgi:hypothetical protein